jgi:hypothetical protein
MVSVAADRRCGAEAPVAFCTLPKGHDGLHDIEDVNAYERGYEAGLADGRAEGERSATERLQSLVDDFTCGPRPDGSKCWCIPCGSMRLLLSEFLSGRASTETPEEPPINPAQVDGGLWEADN